MTLYLVYDIGCVRGPVSTTDPEVAQSYFDELLGDGLIPRKYEVEPNDDRNDDVRDETYEATETAANGWLDGHFKSEWESMPKWVYQSDAAYRRVPHSEAAE